MTGRRRSGGAGGDREDVVHEGRYAVVVEEETYGLVAYPREDPKGREKEYLLYMIDELSVIFDELYERTGRDRIHLHVGVKYGGEWHVAVMARVSGVQFVPVTDDYVDFIGTADLVLLWAVDRNVERFLKVYSGRYAVVVEDDKGNLFAFAHPDARLGAVSFMLAIIGEVMGRVEALTAGRSDKSVVIRGSVVRGDAMYIPIVYNDLTVAFALVEEDYEHFVRMAEAVVFPRLFGQRR